MTMIAVWFFILLNVSNGFTTYQNASLPLGTVEKIENLGPNMTVRLTLNSTQNPLDINDKFWSFEAHSFSSNDHLSLSKTERPKGFTNETGLREGVIQVENHPGVIFLRSDLKNGTEPFAFLSNLGETNVTALVVIRNYTAKYPVPGWMEDNMPQNTLKLYFDASTVNLEFMPAKVLDVQAPVLTYSVYQMYFSERDFNEDHFLLELSSKMLQVDDIKTNGELVDTNFVFQNNNKSSLTYSAYPGTATVFSVIVTTTYPSVNGSSNEAFSSIYVTTCTYACQMDDANPLNCKMMWSTISKVICGLSVFIGGFIAFFGHRYFQSQQFFFGAYAAGLVSFVVMSLLVNKGDISYVEVLGLSFAIAIIGGFLWMVVWYVLGVPILSTALSVSLMGLVLGGVFVFSLNTVSMMNDVVYWMTIAAFISGSLVAVLPFTKTASILSSALVGSFIFIIPIDHYIGSSLKYILVNFVRRAYVDGFNLAVLNFPFQINDIALICGWIGFFLIAFIVQYLRERGRAPFPPNPYQLRRWRIEERSFLSENAINDAEDESRPLLAHDPLAYNERPMSPTGQPMGGEGRQPVVGYISNSNARQNYGSTVPVSVGTTSVMRSLESPALYNAQPRGVVHQPSPRRFWQSSRQNEEVQCLSTSVEERDCFRPPPGHPSQL